MVVAPKYEAEDLILHPNDAVYFLQLFWNKRKAIEDEDTNVPKCVL